MVSAVATIAGALIGASASKSAAKSARKGQQEAFAASQRAVSEARGDIIPGFGRAQITQRQGFGGALDVLRQTEERAGKPFRQGNVLAQQQIQRGLPQVQRAILGQPTDLSGFRARDLGPIQQLRVPNPPPPTTQAAQPNIPQFVLDAIERANAARSA
jgi:hypothetical protein